MVQAIKFVWILFYYYHFFFYYFCPPSSYYYWTLFSSFVYSVSISVCPQNTLADYVILKLKMMTIQFSVIYVTSGTIQTAWMLANESMKSKRITTRHGTALSVQMKCLFQRCQTMISNTFFIQQNLLLPLKVHLLKQSQRKPEKWWNAFVK